MSKVLKVGVSPEFKSVRLSALRNSYLTIRQCAEKLIQLPHHTDKDGRVIGDDYGTIRDMILRKYPTVTNNGPHKGRPTKMSIKELRAIAYALNRAGVKLPFRPRRRPKSSKSKKDIRR